MNSIQKKIYLLEEKEIGIERKNIYITETLKLY